MGNQSKPTPSFNTVKQSNRKARRRRIERSRIVLLAIFVTVIAMLLTSFGFLIASLVDRLNDKKPNDDVNIPNNGEQAAVVYELITQPNTAVHKGTLIVVNEQNEYHFPTTEAALKNIVYNRLKVDDTYNTYMVKMDTWLLDATALDALNRMMYDHFKTFEDGSVTVSSAYRTYDDQAKLNSTVKPGFSDHHTGYCVALQDKAGTAALEANHWIYENCHKYGFVVRYPESKSSITGVDGYAHCFRYVGVAHASYMVANDLCFEEYVQLLQNNYTKDSALTLTAADGHRYATYYVRAAEGDLTTLEVPQNYAYTLSGDNMGGFIVTIHLDEPKNA